MIKNIQIENYKCFRSINVPLKPFTVLIGPNNTGKTNFLRSIAGLEDFVKKKVVQSDCYRFDIHSSPSFEIKDGKRTFRLVPVPNHQDRAATASTDEGIRNADGIGPVRYFDIPKLALPMTSPGHEEKQEISALLKDDAAQVPALVDYLLRQQLPTFLKFVETLRQLVPGLEDIKVESPSNSTRRLDLILDGDFRISSQLASTGVRLMIFFAALAFHPEPPKTILIEEPESGVHPKRLRDIVNLLRMISHGVHGLNPAQVIISTHSPYLLDCVDLENDQVLVFQRMPDGSRTAEPMDADGLQKHMDEFLLGEFWYNGGEDTLIKKKIEEQ